MGFEIDHLELAERFGYHPATKETAPLHDEVRLLMLATADRLLELVPQGRPLALALTSLEETAHWANAGIARKAPVDDTHAATARVLPD